VDEAVAVNVTADGVRTRQTAGKNCLFFTGNGSPGTTPKRYIRQRNFQELFHPPSPPRTTIPFPTRAVDRLRPRGALSSPAPTLVLLLQVYGRPPRVRDQFISRSSSQLASILYINRVPYTPAGPVRRHHSSEIRRYSHQAPCSLPQQLYLFPSKNIFYHLYIIL